MDKINRSVGDELECFGLRIEYGDLLEARGEETPKPIVFEWSGALASNIRGITYLATVKGQIKKSTIKLNLRLFEDSNTIDIFKRVIAHEFGHAVGLIHTDDCDDLMAPGFLCGSTENFMIPRPRVGDLKQCSLLYPN